MYIPVFPHTQDLFVVMASDNRHIQGPSNSYLKMLQVIIALCVRVHCCLHYSHSAYLHHKYPEEQRKHCMTHNQVKYVKQNKVQFTER